MSENIGYHTRLFSDNTRKIVGGSFGGALDLDTINRLVRSQFSVVVKQSGTAVFVDREGREVRLYVSVDVEKTEEGKKAIRDWRTQKEKEQAEEIARKEEEEEEIEQLLSGLSHEEIVRRLSGGN